MKVTTRFDYAKIQAEKAFNLRLMLAIEGDEQPENPRSPLNLALVLDHSGSMSGPKLRNVKEATKQLVKMLHRDDIFSLTIFDDEVTRLIPPVRIGDAHNLSRSIDAIHSGGSTYLSGGFKQGCRFATANLNKGLITRVMLLTDGQANVGELDPAALADRAAAAQQAGITTTTIGVGEDYDESLLSRMAESGGGGSYFIETPDDAPGVFTEELGCLQSLAATDCQVKFLPAHSGISVAQLNSYATSAAGDWLLGDIYGGQQRSLVIELALPPFPVAGGISLGSLEISYRQATGEKREQQLRLQLAVDAVGAAEFKTVAADPHVTLEACFLVVARAKTESIRLADQRKFKEAADLLKKYATALRSLDLSDPALSAELDELELRAEQLRHKGSDFYTVREKKRMHYEADMMSKNRMGNYAAMRERRKE